MCVQMSLVEQIQAVAGTVAEHFETLASQIESVIDSTPSAILDQMGMQCSLNAAHESATDAAADLRNVESCGTSTGSGLEIAENLASAIAFLSELEG